MLDLALRMLLVGALWGFTNPFIKVRTLLFLHSVSSQLISQRASERLPVDMPERSWFASSLAHVPPANHD
jgi:hypothetical protein